MRGGATGWHFRQEQGPRTGTLEPEITFQEHSTLDCTDVDVLYCVLVLS